MPKPTKFSYKKIEPFRDSFLLLIICEGQNREPDYFSFFEGLSSRVKIIPVKSDHGSSPTQLMSKAEEVEEKFAVDPIDDKVWFIIDTDRWGKQLHEIRTACNNRAYWNIAQSNPCFEVWLYFHVKEMLPEGKDISTCGFWKPFLAKLIEGGFNSDFHPVAIELAVQNARKNFTSTGYFPDPGSTELWKLGELLLPLIAKDLNELKQKFPHPKAAYGY